MEKLKKLLLPFPFLVICFFTYAQNTITGKVTDNAGKGIYGITVIIKGTQKGTSTKSDGSFSLVASSNSTLILSGIGFVTKEVALNGQTNVSVTLTNSENELSTVVVTALGIARRTRTLVYATQTVKPAELTEVRDPNNIMSSFQGKVANLVVSQGSGGPGSGARFVLRGNRSIQGDNNALIVVDGVPIDNGTNGTAGSDFGSVNGSDGASNINPDDIESVTILRGASAAALYGSQAGNGVIVITTKKGKKDRMTVSVNSGVTSSSVWSLPKVQNQYGQGEGGILPVSDTLDATVGDSWGAKMTGQGYVNYLGKQRNYSGQPNNIKKFFKNGISTNNSIGVSGGTEKAQTYLSYTNNYVEGIIPKNVLKSHNINFRISNQITSWLSTDAKITYYHHDIENKPRTGEENAPVIDIYQIPRNVSTADAKNSEFVNNVGVPTPTPWPSTLSSIYQNPYWMISRTAINESRDRVLGFLSAKVRLTNWLNISGRANIDRTADNGESQYSNGTILWSTTGGEYQTYNLITANKWFDAMLDGSNTVAGNLKINYRIGTIYQDSKFNSTNNDAHGLNVTNKFNLNFASSPSVSTFSTEVQTQSVYGQVNLSWKDLLFLDASLRDDWDSRLPSPFTYKYPSIGASAIISDIVKLPAAISFLKANINYARVSNAGKFGLLHVFYNYSPGAGNGYLSRSPILPLPGLKPEIVKNLEFGIDARFVNNRIGFTATYYKSNSFNQLLQIGLPVATGYSSKYINAGNIQNAGFELVVTGTPVKSNDFSWDVTLNYAINKNKIIKLSEDLKTVPLAGGYARSATPIVSEGGSYGDLVAYQWATDAKGNHLVVSTGQSAGKPIITTGLQTYIGNFNPKATIGFTNNFQYKAFSLRVLVDGRIGGTMVSGTEMNLAFSGIPEITQFHREGGWSLGGVDANGQPVSAGISAQDFWQIASGKRYGAGQFFAYNATAIRMREVALGYNINIKNIKFFKTAKISAVGRNLFWIDRGSSILNIPGLSKRKMWFDPDMSLGNGNFQGVEYGTLPSTRTIGLNLQFTF
jgi:TonB-linked SusC/RagA family outer membrane protein